MLWLRSKAASFENLTLVWLLQTLTPGASGGPVCLRGHHLLPGTKGEDTGTPFPLGTQGKGMTCVGPLNQGRGEEKWDSLSPFS